MASTRATTMRCFTPSAVRKGEPAATLGTRAGIREGHA